MHLYVWNQVPVYISCCVVEPLFVTNTLDEFSKISKSYLKTRIQQLKSIFKCITNVTNKKSLTSPAAEDPYTLAQALRSLCLFRYLPLHLPLPLQLLLLHLHRLLLHAKVKITRIINRTFNTKTKRNNYNINKIQ
jgi:hypothetical protein